jgi:hypothetical protein
MKRFLFISHFLTYKYMSEFTKWGYRKGFLWGGLLLVLGFCLEIAFDGGVPLPAWPYNLVAVVLLASVLLVGGSFAKSHFISWLGSLKVAVPAMVYFLGLTLLMGLIPQSDNPSGWIEKLGINSLTSHWALVFIYLLLLASLIFSMRKRFKPLNLKNITFLLNHLGLFIVLMAMGVGQPDLYRLQMQVSKERVIFEGKNLDGKMYRTPFALKLIDFSMEEYPPQLVLIDENRKSIAVTQKQERSVQEGKSYPMNDWKVTVEQYMDLAAIVGDQYVEKDSVGSVHACFVSLENNATNQKLSGWISTGSLMHRPKFLKLTENQQLAIAVPEAKDYASTVRIFDTTTDFQDVVIRVNQPFRYKGWVIYQSGYDERFGKWSPVSNLELVFDRWLEIAYVGIFMLIIGSALLIWQGRTVSKNSQKE